MKIAHSETTDWNAPATLRGGVIRFKCMLQGREGTPANFSLVIAETDLSFKSPRHRHNFDQIRVTLDGSTNIGPRQNIDLGDVTYFPEGTYYGPQDQELVGAPSLGMVVQFGGASGSGYMSMRQLLDAQRALEPTGRFADGVYRREDGREDRSDGKRKNQDAYEAIWEHHNNRPLEYPKPRMTEPVHFKAGNVPWSPVANAPGVWTKHLGDFTERHVRIGALRLEEGVQFELPPAEQEQLLFFTAGAGQFANEGTWSKHSAAHMAAGESAQLRAEQASEVLILTLPRFDGSEP